MSSILVNIALANAIFEERKNYLDTYFPFILKSFKESKICNIEFLSNQLKALFDIELPIHSIKDILSRKDKDIFQIVKVSKADWRITLTEKGKKELNDLLAKESEIDTSLLEFYYNFRTFAHNLRNAEYDELEVQSLIEEFINYNLVQISINNGSKLNISPKDEFEKDFILFLSHIKKTNVGLVKTFDHLWKGTIIWNELKKQDQDKQSLEFNKNLSVYVDTNFTLSLLGLHNPIINTSAKELYDLLVSTPNTSLFILDSTIFEIYKLLDLYPSLKDDFYEIEVDSIFYYLKEKGYNHSKLEKLKAELIEDLRDKYKIHHIESSTLTEQKQKWLGTIYDYLYKIRNEINQGKPNRLKKTDNAIQKSSHHDASVITHILGEKDRFASSIENSKAVFLTSSFWLFKNYKNIYKEFEQFSSVILDATLTNILYLKSPNRNAGLAIDQVIKSHYNYLIIDNNIWSIYIDQAKQLLKEEKISTEDYSRLVSKNQFSEQYLIDSDPKDINALEVLNVLESIKKKESEKEALIEDYKKDVSVKEKILEHKDSEITDLKQRITAIEEERANEVLNNKFQMDFKEYQSRLSIFIDDNWKAQRKSMRKLRIRYLILVLISIIVSSCAVIINVKAKVLEEKYKINSNIIFITGLCLAVIIFLIPFVRSFFKHEDVLDSFLILGRNNKLKIYDKLKIKWEKEFKETDKEPKLEEYIKSPVTNIV